MTKPKPRLTMDSLSRAIKPPNNCRVRTFLDGLDEESREVFEAALALHPREFPHKAVRDWAIAEGFDPDEVPGQTAIGDHRAGRKACKCKG